MALLGILALGLAAATLTLHLISIAVVVPRLSRARALIEAPDPAPKVSLLRPIYGLEHALKETLSSGFTLDYPNYELLFCVEDENDPAVALIQELIAAHPACTALLLIGRDPVSNNPKLNNLIKGWRAASGEWVAMADSNIFLPPDYLSQLLTCWDGTTGLVSSPACGTASDNWSGALECAFLNTYQARWQLAADQVGLGYAQGKTLFWNRNFLASHGGPEALGADIAEDAASTKLVRGHGLNVRLARRPFAQPIGRRSFASVWARQLRWAQIRRLDFPALFLAEPLTGAALPMISLIASVSILALPPGMIALYGALWYGAEWGLARAAGWPAKLGDIGADMARDVLIPALWVAAWHSDAFVWKGSEVAAPTNTQE
jgi:ceramide glucosyltransferase